MHEILIEENGSRPRDPVQERRERLRYWLLKALHARAAPEPGEPIHALDVGESLGLSREETFRLVQFLAHHDYLDYVGAGPRVRLTEKGIGLLTRGSGRRRSIRDP